MVKKKNTEVNPEKEKKRLDLKERLQEAADKKDCKFVGDFMNKWNKSNKEKIQDIVKIQDQLIIHMNSCSVSIHTDYMRLG